MSSMWIFSEDGFISIVEFYPVKKYVAPATTFTPLAEVRDDEDFKKVLDDLIAQDDIRVAETQGHPKSTLALEYQALDIVKEQRAQAKASDVAKSDEAGVEADAKGIAVAKDEPEVPVAPSKFQWILDKLGDDYKAPTKEVLCSHLLVRARVEADLDKLAAYDDRAVRFENKTADYQFRMVIKRSAVAQYMSDLVNKIDYDSHVKETINSRAPQIQGGRYSVLSSIWSAVAKWQPIPPYGYYQGVTGATYGGATTGKVTVQKGSGTGQAPLWENNWGKGTTGVTYSNPNYKPTYSGGGKLPKAARGEAASWTGAGSKLAKSSAAEVVRKVKDLIGTDRDDDLDRDNPYEGLTWWEKQIADGKVSRQTMREQLREFMKEWGYRMDLLEAVLTELEERHGTCNLDRIADEELDEIIDRIEFPDAKGGTTTGAVKWDRFLDATNVEDA